MATSTHPPQFTVRASLTGALVLWVRYWDWPVDRWDQWRPAKHGDLPAFFAALGRPA